MSGMRESVSGAVKFYNRGIKLYPEEELYREMSFISYYFHWSSAEVLQMDRSAGQVKDPFHPKHEIKIYRRIISVIPYQYIAGIRLCDCHTPSTSLH